MDNPVNITDITEEVSGALPDTIVEGTRECWVLYGVNEAQEPCFQFVYEYTTEQGTQSGSFLVHEYVLRRINDPAAFVCDGVRDQISKWEGKTDD